MKKLALVLLLVSGFYSINLAQSPQVGWISKFGAAGGVNPMWVMPGTENLNNFIPALGIDKLPENGMFAIGGSGYIYIMFVKNLRVGGYGFSGSSESTGIVNGVHKSARYSVGGGGLTIEYTMPFVRGVAVSAGLMLGVGSQEIGIFENAEPYTFNDQIIAGGNNRSSEITNDFYLVAPTLNIDIPVTRFMALRFGAGYQFTFDNDWTVANDRTLSGVPDDINADMFFFQTGVYFGLFAF